MLLDLFCDVILGWELIIDMLLFWDIFYENYKEVDECSVIKFMVMDIVNLGFIINCLVFVWENVWIICEIILLEVWEYINNLYLIVKVDG